MVARLIRVYDSLVDSRVAIHLDSGEREVFLAELAFKIVTAERS